MFVRQGISQSKSNYLSPFSGDRPLANAKCPRRLKPLKQAAIDTLLYRDGSARSSETPIRRTARLAVALAKEKAGVPSKLVGIEGGGHGFNFSGAVNLPDLPTIYIQWMDKHLRGL